jgi:prepilin-type N-terminal cleavage/methylation domain-containing protein
MKRILKIVNRSKGFSLLELLITLGIFAILMATVTNIIVINIRVAKQIEARTKVREETGYVLKNLKKDIRNASSINHVVVDDTEVQLKVVILDTTGTSIERVWSFKETTDPDDTNETIVLVKRLVGGNTDFMSPSEIKYESFSIDVQSKSGGNTFVVVDLHARTMGMPEGQTIHKRVGISTRVF